MRSYRVARRSLMLALLAWAVSQPAAAQPYPARTITFVVPFAAGGVADVIARIVAQKLGDHAGWNVIIENRGGAGGNLGARVVSVAQPNGYMVLATTSALAVNATG